MQNIVNNMEIWVEACLPSLLQSSDACTCDKCLKDIYALSLNNLNPYYVVPARGIESRILEEVFEKRKDEIELKIKEAIEKVKRSPRHYDKASDEIFNLSEILVEKIIKEEIKGDDFFENNDKLWELHKKVLNNIKPAYVVTKNGEIFSNLNTNNDQYKANVILEINDTIHKMKNFE